MGQTFPYVHQGSSAYFICCSSSPGCTLWSLTCGRAATVGGVNPTDEFVGLSLGYRHRLSLSLSDDHDDWGYSPGQDEWMGDPPPD